MNAAMSRRCSFVYNARAVEVIEHLIWPLITSKTSVKCVGNDGEYRYVRDSILLLNQLDIEHPVWQYILSVCNGFMKRYKTGGDTLLFYICQWTKAASLLCDMGLSITTIITLLRQAVNDCIDQLETHKIDVNTLRNKTMNTTSFSSETLTHESIDSNKSKTMIELAKSQSEIHADDEFIEVEMTINKHAHGKVTNSDEASLQSYKTHAGSTNVAQVEVNLQSYKTHSGSTNIAQVEANLQSYRIHSGSSNTERDKTSNKGTRNAQLHTSLEPQLSHLTQCGSDSTVSEPRFCFAKIELEETGRTPLNTTNKVNSKADSYVDVNHGSSNIPATLKMNGIEAKRDFDDDDDFSWYFTSDTSNNNAGDSSENQNSSTSTAPFEASSTCATNQGYVYDEEVSQKHLKVVENALIASNVSLPVNDEQNVDTDFNDSDLITDIEDLKNNIETDLEIMKIKYRGNGIGRKIKMIDKVQAYEENINEEFETSWFFIESPEQNKGKKVECHKFECRDDESSDFETVQFTTNGNVKSRTDVSKIDEKGIQTKSDTLLNKKNNSNEQLMQPKDIMTNKDLKMFDNLLKSFGKETKSQTYSGTILNNSRHFRTFQSVSAQVNECLFENDKDRQMNKTNVLDKGNSNLTTVVCQEAETQQLHEMKGTEAISAKEHDSIKDKVNIFGNDVTMDYKRNDNKFPQYQGQSQTKVSHINTLLDKLSCYKAVSANSNKDRDKCLASTVFPIDGEVSERKTVLSSAVSVRSRHLNVDSKQLEDTSDRFNMPDCVGSDTGTQIGTDDLNTLEVKAKACRLHQIVKGILTVDEDGIVKVICDIVSRLESQGSLCILEKLVDCYTICGHKEAPRLMPGLILKTSIDYVSSIRKLQEKSCRVLLVNADITPTYRHKGYKSSKVTTNHTVDSFCQYTNKADTWTYQVAQVLQRLSVDVILARGRISEEMTSVCGNLNIVAIETVPYRQLKLLSDITETDMGSYFILATEANVCNGIQISQVVTDCTDRNIFNKDIGCEFSITLDNVYPLTVVFSECTPILADLKEQEFWECFHRVTSCLQNGFLLPGNGQTEKFCLEFLRERQGNTLKTYRQSKQANKHCLPVVHEIIEQSFKKYVDTFHDSEFTNNIDCVYDDYVSKMSAWKTACNTVCTILNTEYYIITGISKESRTKAGLLI